MQLAQVNIALPVAPPSTPEPAGFVAEPEPLNALAEGAPGAAAPRVGDDASCRA